MKLDYSIIHLLHPHYVERQGVVYDHVEWRFWISSKELRDELNSKFNMLFDLNLKNVISEDIANNLWKYLREKRGVFGTYGTDYVCNMLNI